MTATVSPNVGVIYDGLNKSNLKGAYSLDEAYAVKNVLNFIANVLSKGEKGKSISISGKPFNTLDCMAEIILPFLNKGASIGTFTLAEASKINTAFVELTAEVKKFEE